MNKICLAGMVVLSLVHGMVLSTTSIVNAMASSPQETATPFTQQVKNADMIFYGVVTKLENVVIGPRPRSEDGPLPHTYVTYQIKESLKGRSSDGGNVTLRFLGGAMPDGRHLESSEVPTFKVGEYDLLFVWKNTETECPHSRLCEGPVPCP